MAYSKSSVNSIGLDRSPSLLYNNLSTSGSLVCYVHLDDVSVYREGAAEGKVGRECRVFTPKQNSNVSQVKWVTFGSAQYLVVCSSIGIEVYDHTANRLVFFDDSCARFAEGDDMVFARGVTGITTPAGICQLLVGFSSGHIASYEVCDGTIRFHNAVKEHKEAVTALCSSADYWASADDSGAVLVWNNGSKKLCSFAGTGSPCTSVGIQNDTVIASFASGMVRMFRISTGALAAEILAHSRCINALDVHPTKHQVATVGEDCMLHVLSVPDWDSKTDNEVKVIFSTSVPDHLLTGVAFTKEGPQSHIMVVSYDTHSVNVWVHT